MIISENGGSLDVLTGETVATLWDETKLTRNDLINRDAGTIFVFFQGGEWGHVPWNNAREVCNNGQKEDKHTKRIF